MLLPLLSLMSVLTPYGLNVRFVRFAPGEIYGWGLKGLGSSLYDHSWGSLKREKVQTLAFASFRSSPHHLITM
jgi:hypothetical protein